MQRGGCCNIIIDEGQQGPLAVYSKKGSRVFDFSSIGVALSESGYAEVGRGVYRASWSSTEVEHFLYLDFSRKRGHISARYGARNLEAEVFAVDAMRACGGPHYMALETKRGFECLLKWPVGTVASWGPLWGLSIFDKTSLELADKVRAALQNAVLPRLKPIGSLSSLATFLIDDDEHCRWQYVNGAIRAALIVHSGIRSGLSSEQLRQALHPFHRYISREVKLSPDHFVDWLVADAEPFRP